MSAGAAPQCRACRRREARRAFLPRRPTGGVMHSDVCSQVLSIVCCGDTLTPRLTRESCTGERLESMKPGQTGDIPSFRNPNHNVRQVLMAGNWLDAPRSTQTLPPTRDAALMTPHKPLVKRYCWSLALGDGGIISRNSEPVKHAACSGPPDTANTPQGSAYN